MHDPAAIPPHQSGIAAASIRLSRCPDNHVHMEHLDDSGCVLSDVALALPDAMALYVGLAEAIRDVAEQTSAGNG